MTTLQKQIEEKQITFSTHVNSPFVTFLEVLEETPKAIKVKHEETKKTVWIPKSALQEIPKVFAFTLNNWFRQSLIKSGNDYPFYALGIMG